MSNNPLFAAAIFGLLSAASWGTGDFAGGLATKKSSAYFVVLFSQLIGIVFLLGLTLIIGERPPHPTDLLKGAVGGLAGAVGLLVLYQGLARGRMGVVAPIAAVITTLPPLVVSFWSEGWPGARPLLGFGTALLGVWLISRTQEKGGIVRQDLTLAGIAGLGFGLFYISLDQVNEGAVLWPLMAARLASITVIGILVWLGRPRPRPTLRELPIIVLSGLGDTGGNAFFMLAAQAGRLDVAAVLSSLYPATTVLLAWLILKERLQGGQWWGVAAALMAIILITS
ncbi:MAG: DMT family transporter [Chloroflexi bacterium]|nr:DMT family transporter [Chloroflexota bacterium]MBP8055861.1 DMT family transporter [Chloroflexota bacterium]